MFKCPHCGKLIKNGKRGVLERLFGWKDETTLAYMDKAAEDAKADFDRLPNDVKQIVGEFIRDWVGVAGYKRLAKLFFDYVKEVG